MGYEAYDAYLSLNQISTNAKEYYKDSLQAIINDRFEYASDYREINILDRDTLIGTPVGIRLTKTNSMNGSSDLKDDFFKVIFKNFTTQVVLGDLFEFDNYRWIVTDLSSVDTDIQSCMIQRCNAKLNFIYSNNDVMPTITDDIISIDCIAEKRIYDIEKDKYYNLALEDIQIKVPNNSDSRKIKFDNRTGTRFILGNPAMVYDTKGIDSISMVRTDINDSNEDNGILLIKLSFGRANNREDNFALNVAKQTCYGGVS